MNNTKIITNKIKNCYSINAWYAFFSSLIMGIYAHIFILTNAFFNHDGVPVWTLGQSGGLVESRWLQNIFGQIVSPVSSVVITGTWTILFLAISALLLVDTIQVNSRFFASVIGILMSSSPIVASFMSYTSGSYLFVCGIPFAILAVRWFDKGVKGYIVAALSLMCAIAGYQSNIAVTIALMYVVFFSRLLEKDVDMKKWWISFAKAFSVLIVGLVLYVFSTHVVSAINNGGFSSNGGFAVGISSGETQLEGYAAQADTGILYISSIPRTISISVKYFIKYHFNIFFGGANKSSASKINVFSSIVLLLCTLLAIVKSFVWHKKWSVKIMIVLVALMAPICINSTEIILNGKCDETLQMMYSMVMVVPLLVMIFERTSFRKEKINNILSSLIMIAFVLHIYGNIQIVNDAYVRMNSIYETAYSEMCRIIDRVEQLPEWQDGERTLYFAYEDDFGYLINENYQSFVADYEAYIDMGWLGIMGTQVHAFWHSSDTASFVRAYTGLVFDDPTEEQLSSIKNSEEYTSMEKFPSVNSVKVIDGVVVVRMD